MGNYDYNYDAGKLILLLYSLNKQNSEGLTRAKGNLIDANQLIGHMITMLEIYVTAEADILKALPEIPLSQKAQVP